MAKRKSASSKGSSKRKGSTRKPSRVEAIIEGDYPDWPRVSTGLYSLDIALADQDYTNTGFPVPCSVEIYGPKGVGKSTFIYYLAGKLMIDLGGKIVLGDFDGFYPPFLAKAFGSGGYDKVVQVFTDGSAESIFERLMDFIDENEDVPVTGIVDSVSAVIPEAEAEGDMTGRNMGARAFLMAKLARKGTMMHRTREHPSLLFVANHAYQQFGWGGSKTAGGDVYPNLAGAIIQLLRGMREDSWEGSYSVNGRIKKLKHGPINREFQFFVLSGYGVHPGLTAVLDCISQGYAIASNKANVGRVEMDGKKYGWFKNMIKKGDKDGLFQPFIKKLYS